METIENNKNIQFTDLKLSTITVEGELSNMKFDLNQTIEHLLYKVIKDIKDINNINQENIDNLAILDYDDLTQYLEDIINNDFTLYKIIINEMYKQDNTNKKFNNILNIIKDYEDYNKNTLISFKNSCENINNLSETVFTLSEQMNDTTDDFYQDIINLSDDCKIMFNSLNINYHNLYEIINNNKIINNYIILNNNININYDDIKELYFQIFELDIKLMNDYIKNINLLDNIPTTLINYCKNYSFILNNIDTIKKLYEEYLTTKNNYFVDIINIYDSIKHLDIDLIDINKSINNIIHLNKEEWDILNNFIVKIGCNYGEYISDTYKELTKKPIKSNRGRKPKIKNKSNRRKQGTGKYFTSQMTFTILSDGINDEKDKLYHIKIFVNGVIQIPSVTNEDIDIVRPYINKLISYFNKYTNFMNADKKEKMEIISLKSIMRNYKFYSFNSANINYNIKLDKLKTLLISNKELINNENDDTYDIFQITEIKLNKERYPGLILKFDISKEPDVIANTKKNKKPKRTTVKIFSSTKANIDGANLKNTAERIQQFLKKFINNNKEELLYNFEDYE